MVGMIFVLCATKQNNPDISDTEADRIFKDRNEVKRASHSQSTLLSIFSLEYQKRTKRTFSRHHVPDVMERYYQRYLSETKARPTVPVMLELANEVNLSPALMGRIILERFLKDMDGGMPSKTILNSMLKEPSIIPDQILANHIYQVRTLHITN
ncbi:CDAN1-interacting nuclease 1 [Ameca splendens]|uniref:CDAN1-interacting nuclease 1 n=1 Tax=Ameca splendens TaxID=208324 RepID=A0ABV0Z7Q4_9TELE